MNHLKPVNISMLAIATIAGAAFLLASGCHHDSNSTSSNAGATVPLTKLTPISDCTVDVDHDVEVGGPDAKPGCDTVEMNPSMSKFGAYDEIEINKGGTLLIDGGTRTASSTGSAQEPTVSTICIGDGGTLDIYEKGTADAPVTDNDKVKLTFTDKDEGLDHTDICKDGFKKGIEVLKGGSLIMNGAKGVPQNGGISWTTLAAPAGPTIAGAKVAATFTTDKDGNRVQALELTADVTKGKGPDGENEGWQSDDWIVVATTDYTPFHSEFVQIATVTSNAPNPGSTVTLRKPLKYYHFGSLAPSPASATCADPLNANKTQPAFLCDGPDRNYGVDERAEVGLISRNITLTSNTVPAPVTQSKLPPAPQSGVHWGGEIMIHQGFKKVVIQGVRLSKFGKDKLGSYPIHFHLVGDAGNKPVINADSVDHSYNKCVTIHSTSNLTISNMVCARIVGSIFYQELQSAGENNPADDSGLVLKNNLGIGAMSNSFDLYDTTFTPVGTTKQVTESRQELIDKYWWTGDYMTNTECSTDDTCIGYDGFNIPDTDNWHQYTRGKCVAPTSSGAWTGATTPNLSSDKAACPPADPNLSDRAYYVEPAGGFWIQNPNTVLIGNAIAGCQGVGTAFWWGPPDNPIDVDNVKEDLRYQPIGENSGNRASACYNGFFGEENYNAFGGQLFPHKDGTANSPSIISTFFDLTASHIRFRGFWFRGAYFLVKDGHFSTNRESVSLVTSGGVDGNDPGTWHMLEDSVLVGESRNNVGRWGPCPTQNVIGVPSGWEWGCIDRSHPSSGTMHSGTELGEGYPSPKWNAFGYMLYDGPVRVFHDRFVNFNHNESWTKDTKCSDSGAALYQELDAADCSALRQWEATNPSPTQPPPPASIQNAPTPYEGDAALGWFQSNQSAYPTGTASRELMWVNTNLRHQIYTDLVNIGVFNDGDKNTAVIDEDGTLTGFAVNAGNDTVHPISLNNLPFNAISNSVDECLSRGSQNAKNEGRDTSLISPASMGTLEFSNLYPFVPTSPTNTSFPGKFNSHYQYMTFTRTDSINDGNNGTYRPSMTLKSRDGQGIWEPRVSNGYGYTVRVAPIPNPAPPPIPSDLNSGKAGIWNWIDVGLADIVDHNISKSHPFYIRLGINYTDANNHHPLSAKDFTILRGYKSYYGGNFWQTDPVLEKYWTKLDCHGLDSIGGGPSGNLPVAYGGQGDCPAASGDATNPAPVTTLSSAASISDLTNGGKSPNLKVFYYNPATGYLYLNVAQDEPNPLGPSPAGSCDSTYDNGSPNPACPDWENGESYYVCPKNGCIIYTIAVKSDSNFDANAPGASMGQPAATTLKALSAPTNPNKLVDEATGAEITGTPHLDDQGTVYYTPDNATACKTTQP